MIQNGKLLLDGTRTADGIVSVALTAPSSKRYKLRVKRVGCRDYDTYDLRNDGGFELFPLRYGNGTYEVVLYENVRGKTYTALATLYVPVKLSREDASQLQPNQYVNYTDDSSFVRTARLLCDGADDEWKFKHIRNLITSGFSYDYVKALLTKAGTLPDIDRCWEKRMGICQDLAALATAMFRAVGIPAKLVIGYAGKQYHAWVFATVNGEERFYDPTIEVSKKKLSKNYTIERWY